MNTEGLTGKKKRVNLLVPQELASRASQAAKKLDFTISDLYRNALSNYLEEIERMRIEKELEEGYKANYSYYSRMSKEWKAADAE